MMSATEGEEGHGKVDVVREVVCINQVNAVKVEGVKKSENVADFISGSPLINTMSNAPKGC